MKIKRIIFFYDGLKDREEGYACEALKNKWHLMTYPQTELVDISSGVPASVQYDLMIVEDNVPQTLVEDLLPQALKVDEIQSVAVCYGGTILAKLIRSFLEPPKIMTLDFELQDFGDITHGAISKTEELYSKINRDPKWRETVVIGITNHSREVFSRQLVDAISRRNDCVFKKNKALWETLPDILWDSHNRHKMRVESARIVAENQFLRRKLSATEAVVPAKYKLLQRTQHLIGIAAEVTEIARAVQPYFDWIDRKHENYPAGIQSRFPTAVLLRGEPCSGKSDLCRCIAEAFECPPTDWLPKTLGPKEHPGEWFDEFIHYIKPLYERAASTRKVVAIIADDLPLPTPDNCNSSDMGAEWKAYLQTLRDCIYDAIQINKGKMPNKIEAFRSIKKWEGKILWIFAKNVEDEYLPIVDLCRQFDLRFPSDVEARKNIIQSYATSWNAPFAEDALNLAARNLPADIYRGRSLVGSEESGTGFVFWCAERVRELCQERFDARENWFPEVTTEIVQEWLDGPQHRTIMARCGATSVATATHAGLDHPAASAIGVKDIASGEKRSLDEKTITKRRLCKLELKDELNKYQSACSGIAGELTLLAVGKAMGYVAKASGEPRHKEVSDFFNPRHPNDVEGKLKTELLQELAAENPNEWLKVRELKQFQNLLKFKT